MAKEACISPRVAAMPHNSQSFQLPVDPPPISLEETAVNMKIKVVNFSVPREKVYLDRPDKGKVHQYAWIDIH